MEVGASGDAGKPWPNKTSERAKSSVPWALNCFSPQLESTALRLLEVYTNPIPKEPTPQLEGLSNFAMEELKNRFGNFVQKKDIKWCLTVPTIWTDSAKHTIRVCSKMGGLVHSPQCPRYQPNSQGAKSST
ncbi:unnamed protein product [Calypogeia fissa]